MLKTTATAALAAVAVSGVANANVVFSEIHFNTTSTDAEYIELYNDGTGGGPVDISGWVIDLWDSDTTDGDFGTVDLSITIPATTVLAIGETYVLASPQAESVFSITADLAISNNDLENDSSTYVLSDAGASVLETIFIVDPGEGLGQANIGGVSITPDISVPADGSFQAAGFYRTDAAGSFVLTDFFNGPPSDPGVVNYAPIPEPASLVLFAAGLGVVALRRRSA
ncbi:MAG: lamin tail domain-containing protein [Planctomycetota bacterium]